MMERKKKLRITQFFLLILGLIIIYLTYYNKEITNKDPVDDNVIKKTSKDKNESDENLFFNITYTNFDLRGNRYILKSEKASYDEVKPEIVYMDNVHAKQRIQELIEVVA